MLGPGVELRLEVGVEPDADVAELDEAAVQLRRELLELDVDAVRRLPGEAPPPGTRAAEGALLGGLVVGLGREAIGAVVRTIQAWVSRRSGRSVRVTLGGDSIELTNVSDEAQERLIESFLARHASSAP
jgi:membrane-associated two-gene conflict system component 1 (EACC1)